MVSCQSWLHSCAFCCHLLLSPLLPSLLCWACSLWSEFIIVSADVSWWSLVDPSFLLLLFSFLFIVAFIRSSLSREKSDWKRVAVSSSGSSVAAVTSKVTY